MRNTRCHKIVMLFTLLFLCSVTNPAEDLFDYVVTIGNEQLHFIAQPEEGYVIKMREEIGSMDSTSRFLKSTGDVKISPIRGLGQHGVYMVEGQRNTSNNKQTIATLLNYSDVEYVLPLFEVEGAVVAIMPEIIARLRHEDYLPQLMDFCDINECRIIRSVIYTNVEYLLETAQKTPEKILKTVDKLNKTDFIEWAVPDVALEIDLCGPSEADDLDRIEPNDEYFPQQWHLDITRAPEAWTITQGDPNIVVAVIDKYFDVNHPDLVDNIWINHGEIPDNGIDDDNNGFVDDIHGWNFLQNNNILSAPFSTIPDVDYVHGTMCAGLIAAKGGNSLGVTGVTWNCKIMPIRAGLSEDECVRGMVYEEAFRYAAVNGADVISNSWNLVETRTRIDERRKVVSENSWPWYCIHIHSAVSDITTKDGIGRNGKGCIVLAASGNWKDGDYVAFPASLPEVIAVGAIDKEDMHWPYSGSGYSLDVVAPSGDAGIGNLWTTDISGSQGLNNRDPSILDYTDRMGGTSGACPIAAGVAALVLSVDPNLLNIAVYRILSRSSRDLGTLGWNEEYGFGCVDAFAAVTMAQYPPEEIILFVDDDALNDPAPSDPNLSDPNEDGLAEHPYDTIQEAIDNSILGDTIVVLDGTYSGRGNYNIYSRNKTIHIRSESGPENCIVDCQGLGRGFLFSKDTFGGSMLEGLTITNGNGHQPIGHIGQPIGGAIVCWQDSCVTIKNCRLTENSSGIGGAISNLGEMTIVNSEIIGNLSDDYGGGVCNGISSNLTITNTLISGNSARYGGGVYVFDNTDANLINCSLISNTATNGGGLYNMSDIELVNCTFTENSAGYGGGMVNRYGNPTVTNCIFTGNSSTFGGGMYNEYSHPSVTNCTFNGNSAIVGGWMHNSSSNPVFKNCILWNGSNEIWNGLASTITITYSNIQGGWEGEGNIDVDPLLVYPGYWDSNGTPDDSEDDFWVDGDYHLKSQAGRWDPNSQSWVVDDVTSPSIDAGDPNSDWSGETWPHGGWINMGAYGGTRQASMSLETGGMTFPHVAFIFSHRNEEAEDFESLLEAYGCPTTLIRLTEMTATPLDSYDLLIVADDTQHEDTWSDPNSVAAIEDSGKPIVGLGEGGYDFYGVLGLSIGNPNGAHGSRNRIEVIDPNCSLFSTPYSIEIPEDRTLQLYTETEDVEIHLWPIPETVTAFGSIVNDIGYSPLAMEHNRYSTGRLTAMFWGFTESPQKMTEIGKTLFINVVIWTANKAWESKI